jgi:1-deoxy-D-xylulose-5-phosphate synthase
MLHWSLYDNKHPVMIRYPKQQGKENMSYPVGDFNINRWEKLESGEDLVLVAQSGLVDVAIEVRRRLKDKEYRIGLVNAYSLKPLDTTFLKNNRVPIVVLEEQQKIGGLFSAISSWHQDNNVLLPIKSFAIPDAFVQHGSRSDLLHSLKLDANSIFENILRDLVKKE